MALKVMVMNAGSSTLKWSVLELPSGASLAGGVEPLPQGQPLQLEHLAEQAHGAVAVAHRVVHGGAALRATTRIDADVRAAIDRLREVAPLHTARALAGIDAAMRALPNVPHFACFDTAFHATLLPAAYTYPVPRAWRERYGLRRYGFHGLSVTYAHARLGELLGRAPSSAIVAHLGSGCSVTAVGEGGRSVDTTMGFTPLEGLMMGTRSGSIDPGMMLHLLRERGMAVEELDRGLELQSGLLGVSGLTADFREIVAAAERGHAEAQLAFEMFARSVRKAIGQMLAELNGCEALVFTGGIGEHSPKLRAAVLASFEFAGIGFDAAANAAAHRDAELSAPGTKTRVFVIEAREDLTMAREVARALGA